MSTALAPEGTGRRTVLGSDPLHAPAPVRHTCLPHTFSSMARLKVVMHIMAHLKVVKVPRIIAPELCTDASRAVLGRRQMPGGVSIPHAS